MDIKFNISHSALNNYSSCQRCFYYSYLMGFQGSSGIQCYGLAGCCVHKALENYTKSQTEIRKIFDDEWSKHKLDVDKFDFRNKLLNKETYWQMVLVGLSKLYDFKCFEEVIILNQKYCIKGVIDGITKDNKIIDWKTSSSMNDDYETQLQFYAYLFYQKYKKLPKQGIIDYVKLNKIHIKDFTIDDVKQAENRINNFISDIEKKSRFEDFSFNLNSCSFCQHQERCKNDMINKKHENFIIEIRGNKFKIISNTSALFDKVINKIFSYEILNKEIVCLNYKRKYGRTWDGIIYLKNKKNEYGLGLLDKMIFHIKQYGDSAKKHVSIEIIDKRRSLLPTKEFQEKLNNVELYDYQIEAVNIALKKKIGIIKAATSSGKTVIASEFFRKMPVNTLFLVDRLILIQQTVNEFENTLNLKNSIGVITGGQLDIKGNFTVGNIQTIVSALKALKFAEAKYKKNRGNRMLKSKLISARLKTAKMQQYLSTVDCVIVDEVHIAKSKGFDLLFDNLPNTHFRIGLSASPGENDYNFLELMKNVGNIIYDVSAKELIQQKRIMKPIINFIEYNFGNCMNGNFQDLVEQLYNNENRNNIIIDLCKKHQNDVVLILVNRIKHGELLLDKLKNIKLSSFFIRGEVDSSTREKIFSNIRNGENQILIGTSQIVSKGLNLKPLKVIINATGHVSDKQTIQSLGRVLRLHEGKTEAIYYDFYDDIDKFLEHSEIRMQTFKDEGHEINISKVYK